MIDPQGCKSGLFGLGYGGYANDIYPSVEDGWQDEASQAPSIDAEPDLLRRVRQLLHDIQAPVTALRVGVSRAKSLPCEERDLIVSAVGRVEQIAAGWSNRGIESLDAKGLIGITEKLLAEKSRVYPQLDFNLIADEFKSDFSIRVQVDAMARIISNLIDNAAQAGATVVAVRLSARADGFDLVFDDNGCGISDELVPVLLKALPVTTRPGGTGLGLSHAISSLRSWGGDVSIVSRLQMGTKVTLGFKKI